MPEYCECQGDPRVEGFTRTRRFCRPEWPEGWYVHAGCGNPVRAYAEATTLREARDAVQ